MHYLLSYDFVPDFLTRRAPHRAAHLALAQAAVARGELVLGGALADAPEGAVLLFSGPGPEVAEAFARADPYVSAGVATAWRVRPWTTVVGPDAAQPVDALDLSRPLARADLVAFLRTARYWAVSTVGGGGHPQSAVVGVAVTDDLELVFDTLGSTNKASNVRRDPRVALVMWRGGATAQIEGLADEPDGAEQARLKAAYFERFPDGPTREAWPDLRYLRVRPTTVKVSDFLGPQPRVVEWLAT